MARLALALALVFAATAGAITSCPDQLTAIHRWNCDRFTSTGTSLLSLKPCNKPHNAVCYEGKLYCEGSGECGTSDSENNCDGYDVYKIGPCGENYEAEPEIAAIEPSEPKSSSNPPMRDVSGCSNSPTRILCLGDSQTYGMHGPEMDGFEAADGNYPAWTQELLHQHGHDAVVTNLGSSGATAQDIDYNPYRKTDQWQTFQEIAHEADMVVVALGTNDAKTKTYDDTYPGHDGLTKTNWDGDGRRYKTQYKELLQEVLDLVPDCTAVFIGVPPPQLCKALGAENRGANHDGCVTDDAIRDWGENPDIINRDLPAIIKEIGQELGLPLIHFNHDLGDVFDSEDHLVRVNGDKDIRDDSVHPRERGYYQIATDVAGVAESTLQLAAKEGGGDARVVAVRVPTLVAIVFLAAFALGAWAATAWFVATRRSREAAARPLLPKTPEGSYEA